MPDQAMPEAVPVEAGPITLTVNGRRHALAVAPWTVLLDLLRLDLDMTGTKKGCDHGQCGACTVLIVVRVFTHENRPRTAWRGAKYQDEAAPPGTPFRPLYDGQVHFSGQPVALVVATDFATARQAAALIEVQIEPMVRTPISNAPGASRNVPPKERSGIPPPPPPPRGDAERGLAPQSDGAARDGVVFGIGMALEEETLTDHRYGRFMNRNLADHHIPVNADVPAIDVIFVDEADDKVNPLGVKGLGEIGIVGTAAAIANAVFNATGKRVRDLPITLDKLLM